MFGMGAPELLLVFAIVFLLFGAKKLPDLASGLGGAVHNFKKAMRGAADEEAKALHARTDEPVPTAVPKATESVSKL